MNETRNLIERLRQIAESQRMDFDSPNVAATLDDAATTLEALSTIGSVADDEPEWEYGVRDVRGRVMRGSEDFAYRSVDGNALPDLIETVRRRKAGPWVPVP